MNEQTLVSINGIIKNPQNAFISVFDRSFLFGDSIYEATLFKEGVPLFWQEHMERLHQSAEILKMPITISDQTLQGWIENLGKHFHHPQGLLRLVITRGEGAVNLNPSVINVSNNVVLFLVPLNYPPEWYTKGLRFGISSYERNSTKSLTPLAKTGNYLNSQLSLMEAKSSGHDDAIMINAKGFITEGTTNNFWFVKNKTVFTADENQGILKGITRHKVFECLAELQIPVQTGAWTLEQAIKADEAFMTSATKGIIPIVQLGQWSVGNNSPGELTKKLHTAYEIKVSSYIKSKNWK
jgi:branched-chain amino acid aminotransferase